jgi:multidrug resistance efflux pump
MNIRFTNREKQPPDVSQGMKVPYAPGRRVVSQWRWWLILTLVGSPFFYLLYTMLLPALVVTGPGFITLEKETLAAVTESAVEHVAVQIGDRVRRGQVLAELTAPKLDEQIEVVRTMLEPVPAAGAATDKVTYRSSIISLYRQQEQHAARAVAHQEQRLALVSGLFAQEAATAAEVNAVRSQLDGARHTLIQAQLQRTEAEQQAASPTTAAPGATVNIDLLRQQLIQLQAQRQQLTLRAGDDGTVLEILAERGRVLIPGEGVVVVGRQAQPLVLAYLHPGQVKWVTAGLQATVHVSGGPSLHARVRENPSQARRLPAELSSAIGTRDIMVLVTLELIDPLPPERAIEGLPVNVRFHRSW